MQDTAILSQWLTTVELAIKAERISCGLMTCGAMPFGYCALRVLGQEIYPRDQQTPAALGAFHKAEIEKWWPVIRAAGIKVE